MFYPVSDLSKILVIDDEPDIQFLVKSILETRGFEVQSASDHREAFDKLQLDKPDLIFIDVRLPEKDGFEICRQIKGNHETSSIPVIIFSASGSEKTRSRALEAGADDFLRKPFTRAQLIDLANRYRRGG